jgi:GNAT superfamily N-acetyltransferase
MRIEPLSTDRIGDVMELMGTGTPYITPRTWSDYWLYASLFSSTCLLAVVDSQVVGAVMAFRSQDEPDDIYIQDAVVHPRYRCRGLMRALTDSLADRAAMWRCQRLYLTSEPDNTIAHTVWSALEFTNVCGDRIVAGISVITDYKGPGRTRAVYERTLS